jgi:hypothetical protein
MSCPPSNASTKTRKLIHCVEMLAHVVRADWNYKVLEAKVQQLGAFATHHDVFAITRRRQPAQFLSCSPLNQNRSSPGSAGEAAKV